MTTYTLNKVNDNVYSFKGTKFYIKRIIQQFDRNNYCWMIYTDKGRYNHKRYKTAYDAADDI